MAEIVYEFAGAPLPPPDPRIRWLAEEELALFNAHLTLCGQRNLTPSEWDEIWAEGTRYCLLFTDNLPAARACVEKYSADRWEAADVRTAKEYRNRGFATAAVQFVMNCILANGRKATIRTEEDNHAMRHVIRRLGFTQTEITK